MRIEFTARWGAIPPGEQLDLSASLARWLIGNNLAKAVRSAPRDKMIKTSLNKGIVSALNHTVQGRT